MKYGVIVYKDTKNIGDDIQSYAAAQLLPQVDYYIEREHLDVFRPKEKEVVNVIANGWLMYNKLGWPISPCINPLYLSMHFWENDALGVNNIFLEGLGGEDLRKHQPIGCRDLETQKFLENSGIKTWFSGCVTLTLTAKYPKSEEEYICLVDVPECAENYIKNLYPNIKIRKLYHEGENVVSQEADWEERFENVANYLEIYQNAQAVITTRLHCALPCLGMETPVMLLSDDEIAEQGRFNGLEDLVRHGTVQDFINGKIQFDLMTPPQNPDKYLIYRGKILLAVEEFIKNNISHSSELESQYEKYDSEWEKRALWKDKKITQLMHLAIERWNERHKNLEELQKGKDWLENQYYNYKEDNDKLLTIQHDMQEKNQNLREESQNLQKQNKSLQMEILKLKEQIEEVVKEKNNQIFLLQNVNAELEIRNNISNQKNIELKSINKKLKNENSIQMQQNEIYYHTIEEIRNSISWKIGWAVTAIPRMVINLVKKH